MTTMRALLFQVGLNIGVTAIPQLKGKFLFGDIPPGRLFYIEMADIKQGKQALIKEWKISINGTPTTLRELCGSERVDLHFGRDSRGELYILTNAGKVYKLVSAEYEILKCSKPGQTGAKLVTVCSSYEVLLLLKVLH